MRSLFCDWNISTSLFALCFPYFESFLQPFGTVPSGIKGVNGCCFFCTSPLPSFFKPEAPSVFIYGSKCGPQGLNDLDSTRSAGRAVKYIYIWLLSLYINGFTERWKGLEKPLERKAFRKIFSQVPPNFRDHLRGPHFDCGFHLPVPSPAARARFPEWKLARRDNWCATGTRLIAAKHLTRKQTARTWISRQRKKQTNKHAQDNCCYYYPIFRRSDKTRLFNTKEPSGCKSVLFIYIKCKY